MDEDGQDAVLDQMRAVRRHRHPRHDQQVHRGNAEADGQLRAAWSDFQALRDDRPHDEKQADAVEEAENSRFTRPADERPCEADPGEDRDRDDERPGPQSSLSGGGENHRADILLGLAGTLKKLRLVSVVVRRSTGGPKHVFAGCASELPDPSFE